MAVLGKGVVLMTKSRFEMMVDNIIRMDRINPLPFSSLPALNRL